MSRRRHMVREPGKAPYYVSKNRGLALLDEGIEQIKLQLKSSDGEWYQGDYRCGSGMCLAGWIGQLAGGVWAFGTSSFNAGHMVRVPEDDPQWIIDGGSNIHVHDRAMRLLGPEITDEEADALFQGDNTLEMIEEIRDEIAERLADA